MCVCVCVCVCMPKGECVMQKGVRVKQFVAYLFSAMCLVKFTTLQKENLSDFCNV